MTFTISLGELISAGMFLVGALSLASLWVHRITRRIEARLIAEEEHRSKQVAELHGRVDDTRESMVRRDHLEQQMKTLIDSVASLNGRIDNLMSTLLHQARNGRSSCVPAKVG